MATLAATIDRGTLAARPATMPEGSLYYVTDTSTLYRSNGTTWDSVEGGAGYTAENARDDVGAALVAGSGIDITLDDALDTITIAVEAGGAPPSSHTHPSTEITDFAEAVDDRVGALVVAGDGIDVTYNDAAGTLTVAADAGAAPPAAVPRWRTGLYYSILESLPFGTPGTSPLSAADRLHLVPLLVPFSVTVDRIGVNVTTLIASSTIRLGIYGAHDAAGALALLLDAGTVSSASTGTKEITISQALPAGWLWMAASSSHAPTLTGLSASSGPNISGQTNVGGTGKNSAVYFASAGSSSALPASLDLDSATSFYATPPIIYVRAA